MLKIPVANSIKLLVQVFFVQLALMLRHLLTAFRRKERGRGLTRRVSEPANRQQNINGRIFKANVATLAVLLSTFASQAVAQSVPSNFRVPDAVTELNGTTGGVASIGCGNGSVPYTVQELIDGDYNVLEGYCHTVPIPSDRGADFEFVGIGSDEFYNGIGIYTNAGNAASDNELRSFNVVISYIDPATGPQTTTVTTAAVPDTTNTRVPVYIPFSSLGLPAGLPSITGIVINNYGGVPTFTDPVPIREFSLY
ncbi:hypothetical protein [Paracoccus tegillarcae]|nr:hypothetical protein [Paracoccus tegillarcae]